MRAAALRAAGAWNVPSLQGRLAELAAAADTLAAGPRRGHRGDGRVRARPRGDGRSRPSPIAAPRRRSRRWRWRPLEELDPNAAAPRIAAWLGKLPADRADDAARSCWPRVLEPSRRRRPSWPGRWSSGPRRCPPTWPSSASARSAPRAATSPAWSPRCRRPASWTPAPKALTAPEMAQLLADVARERRPGARRGDLPPQGPDLPEVPRDRRGRRAGRARPGEHRRQCPARLPGRLAPPAQQAGQGELPRHRRGHRRRPDLHRDQAPPDRHRAGPARRRGPRGLDPGLARSTSRRWPARSCRRGWPTS